MSPVEIHAARSDDDYRAVGELFTEYLDSLGFTVDFQDVERDVREPRSVYGPPAGRALLGMIDGAVAGVVGVSRFADTSCELKRMYVRPLSRGQGLGRELAAAAVSAARELGYDTMLLDTVREMGAANALYDSLGFCEIPAYRHNPLPGARYLALEL